jgi:DNA repair protein RadC
MSHRLPLLADLQGWSCAKLSVRYALTSQPIQIRDSEDAARLLYASWDQELINIQEQTGALYLNHKQQAIGFRLISTGKLNTTQLDTSLLLSCGLLVRAHAIILCHNHPSGDPTPSRTDIRLTCQLQKTIGLVGMELHDHIILCLELWHSMADQRNFLPDWKVKEER